uniref:Uncharacterized protein n=1 Tax=Arundo donax TaxID=35708 RepID=A0A0A8Y687_ARUDO
MNSSGGSLLAAGDEVVNTGADGTPTRRGVQGAGCAATNSNAGAFFPAAAAPRQRVRATM